MRDSAVAHNEFAHASSSAACEVLPCMRRSSNARHSQPTGSASGRRTPVRSNAIALSSFYHAPHRMLTARFPFLDGATQYHRPHRPQDLHQDVRRCASRTAVIALPVQCLGGAQKNNSHSTPTPIVLGSPGCANELIPER